jgi:hypothetical protein
MLYGVDGIYLWAALILASVKPPSGEFARPRWDTFLFRPGKRHP